MNYSHWTFKYMGNYFLLFMVNCVFIYKLIRVYVICCVAVDPCIFCQAFTMAIHYLLFLILSSGLK